MAAAFSLPSFFPEETRAEASALYLSGDEAHLLLFQSRSSSPLSLGKDFSPKRMPSSPLEVISRRYYGLLKIRLPLNASWPETWPS